MNESEQEPVLTQLGFEVLARADSVLPESSRYWVARPNDPGEQLLADLVNLNLHPRLRRLCENIDKAASVPAHEGIVLLRDTIFLNDMFIALTELPPNSKTLAEVTQANVTQATQPADSLWLSTAKLLRALRYLHRSEVVHAALTPWTIYFNADEALISEFWWAHTADGLPLASCPSNEITDFIPAQFHPYIAPEQMHGDPPSRDSDLYSLGAVLYYLLNGKAPERPAVPLKTQQPGADADLCLLIDRLLLPQNERLNIFMLEAILEERVGT
jgi:serine/threonine protein kinase